MPLLPLMRAGEQARRHPRWRKGIAWWPEQNVVAGRPPPCELMWNYPSLRAAIRTSS